MPSSFWQVIERTQTGERVMEKDFDMSIFRACERLKKQYEIKYDSQHPIPFDDAMADRLWQAGLDFYTEVGTYCLDTGRVFKFSREELQECLDIAPSSNTQGEGKDAATWVHRDVEGTQEPAVTGGVQTALFSNEEMALKIWKGCAAEPANDALVGGVIVNFDGLDQIVAGQPSEIFAYRKSAEVMRKAVAAAGRPGLPIHNNAPTAIATVGMYDAQNALRPDGIGGSGVTEMKMDYDGSFMRMAYGLAAGMPIHGGGCSSTIGGFSGSLEGAAIVAVAGSLQGLAISSGHGGGGASTTSGRVQSRSTREILWVGCIGLQAWNRNSHCVCSSNMGGHPAAGPGTTQYFYEAAAGHIAGIVSGGHAGSTRKFNIGRTPDFGTPIETRWMAELSKSVVGMKRQKACEIVLHLLEKYENNLKNAPRGGTYHELYDVDKEKPTAEYLQVYDEAKQEMARLGVSWREWPHQDR